MADYSTALVQMAQALESQDPLVVVSSADAMSFAATQILTYLPGAPAPAADFVAASNDVTTLVKEDLANEVAYADIIDQLTTAFGTDAFTVGGDAITEYADQMCPEPTDAPSASSGSSS